MANEWNMNRMKGSFGYQSDNTSSNTDGDFVAGMAAGALLGALGIAAAAAAIDEVSTPSYPSSRTIATSRPTTSASYDYELAELRRKDEARRREERELEAKHRRELARETRKSDNLSRYRCTIERDCARIAAFCEDRNFSKKAAAKAAAIYTMLRIYGAIYVNIHEFSESMYIDMEIYDEEHYRKVFLKIADGKVTFSFGLKEYTFYSIIDMETRPYISPISDTEFTQAFWKDINRCLDAAY